jgi:hypothetical protein
MMWTMIRKNRGLEGSLYNKVVPAGKTALDVVLDEKRIEMAFEGHRTYDVFRNKRTLNKAYWGYHLAGLKETDVDLSKTPAGYPNLTQCPTPTRVRYITYLSMRC